MYDDILLPVEDVERVAEVLHHAGEIAHALDGELRVLHVADTGQYSVAMSEHGAVDGLVQRGEQIVEEAGETLDSLGVAYASDVVQGRPAETIVEYADTHDFDLIAMATHGREGLSEHLLGSVTERVVRQSAVPVLTARVRPEDAFAFPYERLLVPTDGSEASRQATNHALDLATALDSTVHALSVVDDTLESDGIGATSSTDLERVAREAVDAVATAGAERDVPVERHIERGQPDEVIRATVDDADVDAVVMGTTGRHGIERVLLGSVAEKTVRTVPVPVITTRHHTK